ncbi:MAG TPA: hypothetical protein VG826_05360 [Pirellulales bacterium]|nr:hypothetical protein [Pirellulales bacterium]
MNPFRLAIQKSRLAFDSEGEGDKYGLIWLALAAAADTEDSNPQANTYADGCAEVLYRWRNYPGFGLQRVADVLQPLIGK